MKVIIVQRISGSSSSSSSSGSNRKCNDVKVKAHSCLVTRL
jgi:hypothetical protein